MTACQPLVAAICGEEDQKREAMRMLFADEHCRKMAWRVYQNCSAGRRLLEWEDFFSETILRFVEAVERAKEVRNCAAFFRRICQNYCYELSRRLREPGDELPVDDFPVDDLFARLATYVDRLGDQCQLLLRLIYYHEPPYDPRDRPPLIAELRKHGYTLRESSLSATITNCKAALRRLVGNELDEYLSN